MIIQLFFIVLFTFNLSAQIPDERLSDWSNAGSRNDFKYKIIIELNKNQLNSSQSSNSKLINDLIKDNLGKSVQILLPEGSFIFDTPLNLVSNVSIKGKGADKTELVFDLEGNSSCINVNGYETKTDLKLFENIKKDDNFIIVNNSSSLSPNDWLKIKFNDKLLVTSDWANGSVAQIQQIKKINDDTIFVNSKFRKDFNIDEQVEILELIPVENISIECLKIKRLDNTAPEQTSNINFNYTVNSRVYNVESENCNFSHIQASNSSNLIISNSYFHHSFEYGGGGRGYGVMLQFSTGEVLVENNIFEHLRHSMILQAGANGNVFSYNYSTDPFWSETSLPTNSSGDIVLHGNYVFTNLFEGNICQNIVIDNSHGANGPLNTFFRNRAELWGIFFSADNSPNQNFIANEITNKNFPYSIINYTISGEGHFLFANNNKGNFSPTKPDSLTIKSLYYKYKPEFLINSEFGGIGFPNLVNSNSIPAKNRFDSENIFDLPCSESPNDIEKMSYEINFYPNPCFEFIFFNNEIDISKIKIKNLLGEIESNYNFVNNLSINISRLKSGVYFIEYGQYCYKFVKI